MICVVVGVHLHLPVHLTPAGPGHGRHVAGQQLLVVPHDLRVARLVLRLDVVKVFENSVAFIIISWVMNNFIVMSDRPKNRICSVSFYCYLKPTNSIQNQKVQRGIDTRVYIEELIFEIFFI